MKPKINFIKSKLLFFSVCSLLCSVSCKKSIEVEHPPDLISTDAVFSDDHTAVSAITGIYSRMMQNRFYFASGAMTLYPAMSADEIYSTYPDPGWDAFKNNSLLSAEGIVRNNIWRFAYFHIYQANAVIEELGKSESVTAALKQQLIAEAKFVRAFCHFYLVNLFGDIPLVVTTDYRMNSVLGRTDKESVYRQIIADLKDAQAGLKEAYPTTGKARPNKWAATALLARVYLYQKDWTHAEAQASDIIHSGAYHLLADLNAVFLANSEEAIWQLLPVINNTAGNNTHDGFYFIPACSACPPDFSLQPSLVNAFEPNDLRRVSWIASKTLNGKTYYSPLKYKVRSNYPSAPTEYYMVLRFAEQYLIRAEARAQQNNLPGALSDINIIRSRAGLAGLAINDKESVLLSIEQERRVELFLEWGHRWFDLKRTDRADAVLAPLKSPNWQPTDALYPIPFEEIRINPALTQNPGY